MGRRAAAGGQDPLGHGHAVEVVGRGLDPDEDDLLAAADPLDGDIGVEHGLADRRARRGVEALRRSAGRLGRAAGSNWARRSWSTWAGLDPADRLVLADRALRDHVDRDLHGGRGGPLRRAGLEHVELAALDRELEVLDVAVVALELLADPLELVVVELKDAIKYCYDGTIIDCKTVTAIFLYYFAQSNDNVFRNN